ncbi:helix-turn-helix transcriptional regulator [Bacillus cereus]
MDKLNYSIDLKYMCDYMSEILEIPVCFVENNVIKFQFNVSFNPFFLSEEEQFNELFRGLDAVSIECPVIWTNSYLENFILIRIENGENLQGFFIIGPCIYSEFTSEKIQRMLNDFQVIKDKDVIVKYYQSVPIIKKHKLIKIGIFSYYLLYRKKINSVNFLDKNKILRTNPIIKNKIALQKSIILNNEILRNDIVTSKKLFESIKLGNKKDVIKYWNSYPLDRVGTLCINSELRNRKNQAIAGITLATRYAIAGGMPSDCAFTISDFYINNLEKLKDIRSVEELVREALYTFAERVEFYKKGNCSKNIERCKNFIYTNIYKKITLQDLSDYTQKNPMYLSTLFRKEVGMSLSRYIQGEKIREAKKLLILTDYSLSDISNLLNFSTQSYFTKIFKNYTNITPLQYRKKKKEQLSLF